jgi:hypothetical protein
MSSITLVKHSLFNYQKCHLNSLRDEYERALYS